MNEQENKTKKWTYTATDVAKMLGVSVDTVLKGIENGTLPIGIAVRPESKNERWRCKIFRTRLEKYLKGEI